MYCLAWILMLLRGFSDALMMRSQQARRLPPPEYPARVSMHDQIFSAHGMIMIFFVAMPFVDRSD